MHARHTAWLEMDGAIPARHSELSQQHKKRAPSGNIERQATDPR
jgi:hypothetical protein